MVRRYEHVVDDMDNAVGGIDIRRGNLRVRVTKSHLKFVQIRECICSDYLSVVDEHLVLVEEGLNIVAFNGLNLLVVLQVLGVHRSRDNMVCQDRIKLFDVLGVKEMVEQCLGKTGKRIIGGREHSERTGTGESFDELASFEGCDKGGEVRSGDGEFDNVLCGRSFIVRC